MMNKIAILTTHRANNFGAILQAFALVTKCKELGSDAEILDWRTPLFEWQYYNPWRQLAKNPLPGIKFAWRYFVHERRSRRLFAEFRSRLPMSPKITSRDALRDIEKRYCSFIVGSDQVWNPEQTACNPRQFDRTYLLDFVKHTRKNAYATSIGKESINPPELIPEYRRALETFDIITMREIAGAQFLSNILGRDIEVVLDPVLLHDAEFWRKYESPLVTPNQNYILIYNVQHYRRESQWMIDEAYRYAYERHYRVIDLFVPSAMSSWTVNSVEAGPAEFVHLIDNAVAVFTNSFHAAAFCVIFAKKLFLHRSDAPTTTNSRFDTLSLTMKLQTKEISVNGAGEKLIFCACNQKQSKYISRAIDKSILLLSKMILQ